MKERIIGLVMLLAGGLLSYFGVYEPLESAHNGATTVSTSLKAVVLAPLGVIVGVLYLVLGQRVVALMGTRAKPKTASYVISIGMVLLGLGLYLWLRSSLEANGYDFQGQF